MMALPKGQRLVAHLEYIVQLAEPRSECGHRCCDVDIAIVAGAAIAEAREKIVRATRSSISENPRLLIVLSSLPRPKKLLRCGLHHLDLVAQFLHYYLLVLGG